MSDLTADELDLARVIVAATQLEDVAPEEIPADQPLFGDGLGLDSIDALEIALAISTRYGFDLRSDDENNTEIFASLRNLTSHVVAHRTR